jgi:hypothetical protein
VLVMAGMRGATLALVVLCIQSNLGWCQSPVDTFLPPPRPAPYVVPPPGQEPDARPQPAPFVDDNGTGEPGLFADVNLYFLRPHFNSHFNASLNQGVDAVFLTTEGALGTTVSPWFAIGYRMSEQLGEWRLAYRFEIDERTQAPTDPVGGNLERDRLNVNLLDLDWAHHSPWALPEGWDLMFNVGVRVATCYFDTERTFAAPGNSAGQLSERVTSNFWGLGPEAGWGVTREIFLPGLKVGGRVVGAQVFGNIRQHFSETVDSGAGPVFATDRFKNQVSVTMLTVEAGLTYAPPTWEGWSFAVGYVWEEFWQIGRLNSSNADLLNRGLFFRVEFDF